MFVETLEAVSTGVSTIELSGKLLPRLKRVLSRLKEGELKIAIFGAGGTGKSTLGRILSGEFAPGDLFSPYRESIATELYQLQSNVAGSVIVVPGQRRREDTWDDLLRMIVDGKIKLIINLVSWGYHSFGELSYQQHPFFQDDMQPEMFVKLYTESCRERELNVLEKLAPHLEVANQSKTVFVTLATKQDLWWNHRQQVKNYYLEGDYETIIEKIRSRKGSANFTHEYHSASLIMENFVSGMGELLVPTTAGYDQRLQCANFSAFLGMIESIFNISLDIL